MELYVSFQEIARYFRSHRKNFILFILAVGILCGLLPLKFARYSYSGSTTLTFTCDVPSNAESDYQLQYTNILYSRVQSAVALASGDTLLEKTAEKAGIDPSDISKITAVQLNSAPVVKLTVYTPDAENAARLSDTAAQILGEEMEKQFPSPKLSSSVSDRSLPSKPKSKKIAVAEAGILGLLLGFVLSVAFGILRVLCDKTVRNGRFAEEDLKLPLLAEIPAQKKEDAYRRMRTAVLHHAPDAGVFLVTGVFRENGAADVAAGFASSLARIGKKVLAVDADLRGSALSAVFGISSGRILSDVLGGKCSLSEAVVPISSQPGLSVLPSSPLSGGSPADLLAGAEFQKLLAQASGLYDAVVLLAPSDTDYPEAEALCPSAHAVILSVRYGRTPYRELRESLRRLKTAGGRVEGFVATGA